MSSIVFGTNLGSSGKRSPKGAIYSELVWYKEDITDENQDKLLPFRTRYVLQATVHNVWRERNRRRHGETASPPVLLAKLINKTVRNKFSMIQKKDKKHEGGLQFWFGTRHD